MLKETVNQYQAVLNNNALSREEKISDLSSRSNSLVAMLRENYPQINADDFFSKKVKEVLPDLIEVTKKFNINLNDEKFIYTISDEAYQRVMDITFFNVWYNLLNDLEKK